MKEHDGHLAVRLLVENAFSHLTWHETSCQMFGFQGISQVWRDEPAWYFWLDNAEGAFLVRLHDDEEIGTSQFISLAVHYYPPSDKENLFPLSTREREILFDDELFDKRTCTPHFEAFETCLNQFICAEIGLMIEAGNRLQLLVYGAEHNIPQPADKLFDLFVNTLNFETRRHHSTAWVLNEESVSSLFLVYDENAFENFLSCFRLGHKDLQPAKKTKHLEQWRDSSRRDASCSVHGVCSCH